MTERNDRDNLKCIRCGTVATFNDDAAENASGWEQDKAGPGSICPTCSAYTVPITLSDAEMGRMDGYRRALWARQPAVSWNDRDSMIEWLQWNDPNGCYRDADMITEGFERGMTLEETRAMFAETLDIMRS